MHLLQDFQGKPLRCAAGDGGDQRAAAPRFLILGSASPALLRAFLASSEGDSLIWRRDFIRALLKRDLPQVGMRVPGATLPAGASESMRQALQDLDLDQLLVVRPGDRSCRLNERARVLPLAEALATF